MLDPCLYLVLLSLLVVTQCTITTDADLFVHSQEAKVMGPSTFPKPTDKLPDGAVPIIEPIVGRHRPDHDAILAYAEGYDVRWYLSFIESLKSTGFQGDLVLLIAEERVRRKGVLEYLAAQPFLVVYSLAMDCCDTDQTTPAPRRVMDRSGGLDIFQMCVLNHVYGWKDELGNVVKVAPDPRIGRVVATLRYEWYWMWAQHYNPNSWLMLIDARDTFFQLDPFANLPRRSINATRGKLWFYGENANATRLGRSTKNVNWLKNGYGTDLLSYLTEKPTICSGSTMGERVAMEEYLKAEISEDDETPVRMTGSDQGYHNYLYYSQKLRNVHAIESITVWEQGKGLINNLGALRRQTLQNWGMYNNESHEVYQWDGSLSPVVHQWDRDAHLHRFRVKELMRKLETWWGHEYQRMKGQGLTQSGNYFQFVNVTQNVPVHHWDRDAHLHSFRIKELMRKLVTWWG